MTGPRKPNTRLRQGCGGQADHREALPDPLRVALVGAGNRSFTVYVPLFQDLAPWLVPVAVCDPVSAHAQRAAERLGAPVYTDLRDLVRDGIAEAALVVTPIESHHSISVYLSTHGIHNLIETSWCDMLCRGREMKKAADENNVLAWVADQFPRAPLDRFAAVVRDANAIGRIQRIVCYGDHTGYHNNSRWITYCRSHPKWVQCIEHTMEMAPCHSTPERRHESELLTTRFFGFPDDFLVLDAAPMAPRPKGHWGRCPRPGYTEWQGYRGTLVQNGTRAARDIELRRLSDQRMADGAAGRPGTDRADDIAPVIEEDDGHCWIRIHADIGGEHLEYANPWRHREPLYCAPGEPDLHLPSTGAAVMDTLVDFALAARGLHAGEFNGADALMSTMMEVGARESALQEGRRIPLPLPDDVEADEIERERQQKQFGLDPLDVEGMLNLSFPKP